MTKPVVNPWRRFIAEELRPYLRSRDRKPFRRQAREALLLWRLYRYPPYQYVQSKLYERSFAGSIRDYPPTKLIQAYRNACNPPEARTRAHDKQSFYRIMTTLPGARVPATIRTTAEGDVEELSGAPLEREAVEAFVARHGPRLFLKPVFGRLGRGARVADLSEDPITLLRSFPGHLVQERIIQHPELARLHPASVNTIRLDTFLDDSGACVHNAAVLRMGIGGSLVDNWAAGGIAVGVDLATGRLHDRGRRKNRYLDDRRFDRHPDTGVIFSEIQIPFWQETKTAVCKAAEAFRPLRSLGWDVAITAEGPVLVEANVGWHIDIMQQIWGGLAPTPIGRAALATKGLASRR